MKKKKKKQIIIPENYLERVPARPRDLEWEIDDSGNVTLKIKNTGWANWLAQKLLFRPEYSYVHLDELGSFIWPLLDGTMSITEIGKLVDEKFGEEAHPLYERLAVYFKRLDSYHFVEWCDKKNADEKATDKSSTVENIKE